MSRLSYIPFVAHLAIILTHFLLSSTRDDWKWSSVASPVEYLNWADGEPNNHFSLIYGSEECVEIEDSSGEWNDENCDSLRPYVCQKSKGSFRCIRLHCITGLKKAKLEGQGVFNRIYIR